MGPFLPRMCVPPAYCVVRECGGVTLRGLAVLCYLSLSEWVSQSTSSQRWGGWYFPRFLLGDGSLIWLYITSFMVLVIPCDSQSTIVKHSKLTGCPVVRLCSCIEEWALRCSFSLSPNDLPDSPIYSSRQLLCGHLNQYITPLLIFNCPTQMSVCVGGWVGTFVRMCVSNFLFTLRLLLRMTSLRGWALSPWAFPCYCSYA